MLCEPHPPPSMHEYPISMNKFIWFGDKKKKKKTHTCKNLYKRWYIYYSGLFLWTFPFYKMLTLMMVAMWGEKKSEEDWLLWQYANLAKCKRWKVGLCDGS